MRKRNYAELKSIGGADAAVILKELVDAGVPIREFTTRKLSLDEILLKVYGDERRTPLEP